jgi:hypothetical protein
MDRIAILNAQRIRNKIIDYFFLQLKVYLVNLYLSTTIDEVTISLFYYTKIEH